METGDVFRLSQTESTLNFSLSSIKLIAKFGVRSMKTSTKVINSPNDRNGWAWGFTSQAESWNGRLAMIGFVSALLIEFFSGQGVLHFWNLM
jgi:hypothetical protein